MRCSFCGLVFEESEGAKACGRCALFGGCKMTKCPGCGYEMPRTPGLVRWLEDRSKKMKTAVANQKTRNGVPLCDMKAGGRGVVLAVDAPSAHERNKLMALGIMPGSDIRLLQRFPSYVVAVGFTQLALDREVARTIQVDAQAR